MNVRRALTAGLLVLGTAAVAGVPAAASAASAPVTVRGDGWSQQGTYDDPMTCQTTGVEGVGEGQWAAYQCATNDEGTWDLWVNAG